MHYISIDNVHYSTGVNSAIHHLFARTINSVEKGIALLNDKRLDLIAFKVEYKIYFQFICDSVRNISSVTICHPSNTHFSQFESHFFRKTEVIGILNNTCK